MRFIVKFSTLGMNFDAGVVDASSVDSAKPGATDLISRRNLKRIDSASIVDEAGTVCAVIDPRATKNVKMIDWVTVR